MRLDTQRINAGVSALLPRVRDEHGRAIHVPRCVYGHADSVNPYDHARVYVHVCVREHARVCAHGRVSCLHESVHGHVHARVCVRAHVCARVFLSFHVSFSKFFLYSYLTAKGDHIVICHPCVSTPSIDMIFEFYI